VTVHAIKLETERLFLRELVEADAKNLVALNASHNVVRYTGDGPLADEAAALVVLRENLFPQYRTYSVGRWAVERKSDGRFLGWCGLRWHMENGEYDLGYRFLEEHWGHGYATESARACLALGRARFPEARIVAKTRVENAASRRVLEKLGLTFTHLAPGLGGEVAVYVANG
jgi:[ribosomal protein S5]-alanine N-acetyltransferase